MRTSGPDILMLRVEILPHATLFEGCGSVLPILELTNDKTAARKTEGLGVLLATHLNLRAGEYLGLPPRELPGSWEKRLGPLPGPQCQEGPLTFP